MPVYVSSYSDINKEVVLSEDFERKSVCDIASYIVRYFLREAGRSELEHYLTMALLRDFLKKGQYFNTFTPDATMVGLYIRTSYNTRTQEWSWCGNQDYSEKSNWAIEWPELLTALLVEKDEYRS